MEEIEYMYYFDGETNECKALVPKEKYDKLQNNWNELKKFIKEVYDEENKYNFGTEDYAYNQVLCYIQKLEQGKDE